MSLKIILIKKKLSSLFCNLQLLSVILSSYQLVSKMKKSPYPQVI